MSTYRLPLPNDSDRLSDLIEWLQTQGVDAVAVRRERDVEDREPDSRHRVAILDTEAMSASELHRCGLRCRESELPVVALVSEERIYDLAAAEGIDDFLVTPASRVEVLVRAERVLAATRGPEGPDVIRAGDLVVNPAAYEVTLKGRRVPLRFKEYELLRLLAANPGRVYTRETLLSQVWGYDYLGGTRTVDVHVRRLRSKIEDSERSYIETVWNVGYRFTSPGQQS